MFKTCAYAYIFFLFWFNIFHDVITINKNNGICNNKKTKRYILLILYASLTCLSFINNCLHVKSYITWKIAITVNKIGIKNINPFL